MNGGDDRNGGRNKGRGRLAVDIGGTFTDVALEFLVDNTPARVTAKVLTTARAPEQGVMLAVAEAMDQAGLGAGDIDVIIHGTTLATNALIERKGANTAFITTQGFRDVLETGFEKRFEHYDVNIEKPKPLVGRTQRFTVPERMSARGDVLLALDEDAVRGLVPELERLAVTSVAIGFLHSYVDDSHERRTREIIAEGLPGLSITISAEVGSEIREYERFSTACANAYVQPLMSGYLRRLAALLIADGLTCPLFLMMSGGGLTTLDTAARFPIRLVESGPAGGAILASHVARECGFSEVVAFDMGGTTAKICLITDSMPEKSRRFEVARMYRNLKGSGLPVRVPVIEMVEIGAGGGSIARVDAMRRITVGPDSAGSEPGPACYGRGGVAATVTDANLVLGKIDASRFAGGQIVLNTVAAAAAVQTHVGEALALDGVWAAAGIGEIVEENMANAARVHAIERGKVIGRHTMIAFGGGAPLHAGRLADKLGIDKVVVPLGAGVGSAIGFLRAPISYEVVRSRHMVLDALNVAEANTLLAEMRASAEAVVRPGAPQGELDETRLVDMRYVGQGHELPIDLPAGDLMPAHIDALKTRFEARYAEQYGLNVPNMAVEILTWSLTLSTPSERADEAPSPTRPPQSQPEPVGWREMFDSQRGEMVRTAVFWRPDLQPGAAIEGPAVITEDETATVVPAAFDARIDGRGYIVLERRG
ncbi:MAG: hydantoinase/oxoprolinase family protein [Alphaproteobacteria bacterium]